MTNDDDTVYAVNPAFHRLFDRLALDLIRSDDRFAALFDLVLAEAMTAWDAMSPQERKR